MGELGKFLDKIIIAINALPDDHKDKERLMKIYNELLMEFERGEVADSYLQICITQFYANLVELHNTNWKIPEHLPVINVPQNSPIDKPQEYSTADKVQEHSIVDKVQELSTTDKVQEHLQVGVDENKKEFLNRNVQILLKATEMVDFTKDSSKVKEAIDTIERLYQNNCKAFNKYSQELEQKIARLQYKLMLKFLEEEKIEEAEKYAKRFKNDSDMTLYISNLYREKIVDLASKNLVNEALILNQVISSNLKEDDISIDNIKFWEIIKRIETEAHDYSLPTSEVSESQKDTLSEASITQKDNLAEATNLPAVAENPSILGRIKMKMQEIKQKKELLKKYKKEKLIIIRYDKNEKDGINKKDIEKFKKALVKDRDIRLAFGEGITEIPYQLFSFDDKEKKNCAFSVVMPTTLEKIEESAFRECKNLKRVDLSRTKVKSIGALAFTKSGIEEFIPSDLLEEISGYTFSECEELKSIDLSRTKVKSIGENAFRESGIEEFIPSDSLEEIGSDAFCSCKKLKSIDLSRTQVKAIGKVAFKKSGIEEFIPSDSLEEIGDWAFLECKNLKKVDLSRTQVKAIGRSVFSESSIEEFIPSNSLERIGKNAFSCCENLKKIDLSRTKVKLILWEAFYKSGIEEFIPSRLLKIIDYKAFSWCKNLKRIDLSQTKIENIYKFAFHESGIEEIIYPKETKEDVTKQGENAEKITKHEETKQAKQTGDFGEIL